jgi:hypothetical protein
MKKLLFVTSLVVWCGLTLGTGAQSSPKANWLTDGGDVQRTGWQRNETTLTTANVKDLRIVWKVKLDNEPREMHALLPVLIVGGDQHRRGPEGNRCRCRLVRQHLCDRRPGGADPVEETFRVSARQVHTADR